MEDQQSGSRDLIDVAVDETEEMPIELGGAEDAEDAEDTEDSEATESAEPVKRRRGRRPVLAAAACAALFVGAAAFGGAAAQPYLVDRARVATKLEIVRTAVNAITTLWNYTPENMDTLVDRAAVYLSGDLEAEYRKFIDVIAPANKQAKVTDTTEITGAAVESLDGPEATVIVYTNTAAASEATKAIPSLKYLSYRLSMRQDHGRWVVTKMPTITSLDLTPRL